MLPWHGHRINPSLFSFSNTAQPRGVPPCHVGAAGENGPDVSVCFREHRRLGGRGRPRKPRGEGPPGAAPPPPDRRPPARRGILRGGPPRLYWQVQPSSSTVQAAER